MKIIINTEEIDLMIPIPTFMIDSIMTRGLIKKGLKKVDMNLTLDSAAIDVFLKTLAQVAKEYRGLELVSVDCADGEVIKVVL